MPIGNDGRSYATDEAAAAANARVASGASPAKAAPSPAPSVTANDATSQKPSPQSTSGINQTSTAAPTTQAPTATPPAPAGQIINGYQNGTGTNDEVNANGTTGPGSGSSGFNGPATPKAAAAASPPTAPKQGDPNSTANAAAAGSTNTGTVTDTPPPTVDPVTGALNYQTKSEQQGEAAMGSYTDSLSATKAANIGDEQKNLADQMARYDQMDQALQDMNASRIAAIGTATAASQAAADSALAASQMALDIQKKQTLQQYNNLQIAQAVQNKQRQIGAETELGMLGGNFTTAGVADIQDTILSGEHAMVGIQQNQDIAMQGLTSEGVNIQNDYRDQTLKIEQFASDSINTAYQDLQKGLMDVMNDKNKTEDQITTAINGIRDNYNKDISKINADTLAARTTLGDSMMNAAQYMDNLAVTKQQNARTALTNLSNTVDLTKLTPIQTTALSTLETQAYGPGMGGVMTGDNLKWNTLAEKNLYQNITNPQTKIEIQQLKNQYSNGHIFQAADGEYMFSGYNAQGNYVTTDLHEKGLIQNQYAMGTTGQIYSKTSGQIEGGGTGTTGGTTTIPPLGTEGNIQGQTAAAFGIQLDKNGVDGQGGQCGDFVDKQAGMGQMGDTIQQKKAVVDANPLPGPVPGAVFVMDVGGKDAANGHTGIVDSVSPDGKTIKVLDSNWSAAGQVSLHDISASDIYGYTAPKGGAALDVYNKSQQSFQGQQQDPPGLVRSVPPPGQEPPGWYQNLPGMTISKAEIVRDAQDYTAGGSLRSSIMGKYKTGSPELQAISKTSVALSAGQTTASVKGQIATASDLRDQYTQTASTVQTAMENADKQYSDLNNVFSKLGINTNDATMANATLNDLVHKFGQTGDVSAYQAALTEIGTEYSQIFGRYSATGTHVGTENRAQDIFDGNIKLSEMQKVIDQLKSMGNTVVNDNNQAANDQITKMNSLQSGSSAQTSSTTPTGSQKGFWDTAGQLLQSFGASSSSTTNKNSLSNYL